MNLIFFCQSVSESDPIIADTLSRIKAFAEHEKIHSVDVICLRGERKRVGNNINIYPIQPPNRARLLTLWRLIKSLTSICRSKKISIVYLYMTPTVAPIFYILKPIFKYKIVSWFGHAIYTPITKISLLYFTDRWLNANKSMTTFHPTHLRFIGQGTDPTVFFPEEVEKKYDLVTVGRITAVKNLELIVDAIKLCQTNFSQSYTLQICGDSYVSQDVAYKEKLKNYIKEQGLSDQIIFAGSVQRNELRHHLNAAKAFVFASPGGVGKVSVEAMACGLPLIISSPEANDFFGDELAQYFLCPPTPPQLAEKIHATLSRSPDEIIKLKKMSLELFNEKFSLKSFVARAIKEFPL